jgi:hypothetical protein
MRFTTDLQAAFYACAMRFIEDEVIAQKIAFACSEVAQNLKAGKNMRDEFAMAALMGLLANPKLQAHILKTGGAMGGWIEESAWSWADGMMEQRK